MSKITVKLLEIVGKLNTVMISGSVAFSKSVQLLCMAQIVS